MSDTSGIKFDLTIKVWPTLISLVGIIAFVSIFYTTTIADHKYIEEIVKPHINDEKQNVRQLIKNEINENSDIQIILYRVNEMAIDLKEMKTKIK